MIVELKIENSLEIYGDLEKILRDVDRKWIYTWTSLRDVDRKWINLPSRYKLEPWRRVRAAIAREKHNGNRTGNPTERNGVKWRLGSVVDTIIYAGI